MTIAMKLIQRRLPLYQQYPLPPRLITMSLARKVGQLHELNEPRRTIAANLAHYGYGASVGSIFGLFAPRNLAASALAGAGYGLLVWAISYLGLLPALELYPSATIAPRRRNMLMVVAHLIWGATLGAICALFQRRVILARRHPERSEGSRRFDVDASLRSA